MNGWCVQVHFVGRLANYKYFNMDATIVNALDMWYQVAGKPDMKDMPGLFGKDAHAEVAGEGFVVGASTKFKSDSGVSTISDSLDR